MGKDEIIARILESLQSEAIDEIWARQHITDAFEEGFDAGAQSKEEAMRREWMTDAREAGSAWAKQVNKLNAEIKRLRFEVKEEALKDLFSSVTPCGKTIPVEGIIDDSTLPICGDGPKGKVEILCDLCRGRAVGREEGREEFVGEMLRIMHELKSGDTYVAPEGLLSDFASEISKWSFKSGRLNAAKKIYDYLIRFENESSIWQMNQQEVLETVDEWIKSEFGVGK